MIDTLEADRAGMKDWIAGEIERGLDYALENFALLYGAYSDSPERHRGTAKGRLDTIPFQGG